MNELKLCPVCGGENTYERHEDGWATCSRCGMEANSIAADVLEERSTRAERTCRIVKTWKDSDYVDDWNYNCSECGGFIDVYERDLETGNVISAANYCSNCGARVIWE